MALTAPGVYASIQSSGNKPMEATGASTAAFIGLSKKGRVNDAVMVTSWSQYEKEFGSFSDSSYLAHAVYGYFANGGSTCYVCNIGSEDPATLSNEEIAARIMGEDKGPGRRSGLQAFKDKADVSLVAAPGYATPEIHTILISHCEELGDRFAVLDSPEELTTGLDDMYRPKASPNASYYFPWVQVFDPVLKKTVAQPPSGYVAGLVARTDSERGIHKAPANETLRGVTGLKYTLTKAEQSALNPRGINLIRDFGDLGIKVYGARTLSSDPEWKYINVRRLFLNVRETIEKGTEWAVFEPNNEVLWGNLKRNISAYLKTMLQRGALAGTTPEEAFYVICDKSNNPQEMIDQGMVSIDIGIAPLKPAEFVQINIQQHYADAE
jgi:phage tail sheath protein FI